MNRLVQASRLAHPSVSLQTVRFYERQKLLPDPERSESGYRIYDDEDLHRLRFIRHAKGLKDVEKGGKTVYGSQRRRSLQLSRPGVWMRGQGDSRRSTGKGR